MKRYLIALLFLFASCDETCEECVVVETKTESYCYEITPLDNSKAINGYIEGDIIPDKGYLEKGFVSGDLDRRWKDGVIPYFYEELWTEELKNEIDISFEVIEAQTGVTFIRFESEEALLAKYKDGVKIRTSLMGSSNLGRQGGIQELFLTVPYRDYGDEYIKIQRSTTFHEVGHLVGLHHEHTRPDRDNYVQVFYENIYENNHSQFYKQEGSVCGEYDYLSVMHYSSYAGSIEDRPAILTIDGDEIPENLVYSEGDLLAIEYLYQTNF